jgi:hypothetical protein
MLSPYRKDKYEEKKKQHKRNKKQNLMLIDDNPQINDEMKVDN